MEIIFHPEVDNDLLDAMEYYSREVDPQLALDFYTEFRRCAKIIEARANSFRIYALQLRRLNFHRFPYHILFEIISDKLVQLVTVKHDSMHPSARLERSFD